jgi:hypothetical protein
VPRAAKPDAESEVPEKPAEPQVAASETAPAAPLQPAEGEYLELEVKREQLPDLLRLLDSYALASVARGAAAGVEAEPEAAAAEKKGVQLEGVEVVEAAEQEADREPAPGDPGETETARVSKTAGKAMAKRKTSQAGKVAGEEGGEEEIAQSGSPSTQPARRARAAKPASKADRALAVPGERTEELPALLRVRIHFVSVTGPQPPPR